MTPRDPMTREEVRKECCTICNQMVDDWVDPDWAKGRVCRPCDLKHDPERKQPEIPRLDATANGLWWVRVAEDDKLAVARIRFVRNILRPTLPPCLKIHAFFNDCSVHADILETEEEIATFRWAGRIITPPL